MSSHEHLWKKGFSKPNSTPVPNPFKIQRRRAKVLSPTLSPQAKLQLKQQADQISQLGYNSQKIPIQAPAPTAEASPIQSKAGEITKQQPTTDAVDIQADASEVQQETKEPDDLAFVEASDASAADSSIQRQEIPDSEAEAIPESDTDRIDNQEEETEIQAKAKQPARNFLELPINDPGTSPSSIQRQGNLGESGNPIQQQSAENKKRIEPEAEQKAQESDETIQRQEIPEAEEEISSSEPQTVQRQGETSDTPNQQTEQSEEYHNFLEIPVNVPGTPSSSIPRQVNLGRLSNQVVQPIKPTPNPGLNRLNTFKSQRIESPVKPVNPVLNQSPAQTVQRQDNAEDEQIKKQPLQEPEEETVQKKATQSQSYNTTATPSLEQFTPQQENESEQEQQELDTLKPKSLSDKSPEFLSEKQQLSLQQGQTQPESLEAKKLEDNPLELTSNKEQQISQTKVESVAANENQQPETRTKEQPQQKLETPVESQAETGSGGSMGNSPTPPTAMTPQTQDAGLGGGTGGKGAASAPQEAVTITAEDPGQIIEQLKNTPPTQAVAAYAQAETASVPALEKQKQNVQETIPEIPAPTGLPAQGTEATQTAEKATTKAAQSKGEPKVEVKAEGSAQPEANYDTQFPEAPPAPPPAPTQLAGGKVQQEGQNDEALSRSAQHALSNVQMNTSQISTSAGERPNVDLNGEANPAQIQSAQTQSNQELQTAKAQAVADTNQDFGENSIFPKASNETLKANKELSGISPPTIQGLESPAVPGEAAGGVNQSLTPLLREKIGAEQEKYQAGKDKFDTDTVQARADADQEIAGLDEETKQKQIAEQEQAKAEVTQARQEWRTELDTVDQDYQEKASQASQEQRDKIDTEKLKGEEKAAKHLEDAEKEAEQEKQKADKEANKKKEEGEKESGGFWGWVKSKAKAFIDGIKQAVNTIFDNLRKAVKAIFEAAKNLAMQAIDLARKAIVGLIKGFGEILKGLVKVAFAAFPEIAKKINAKIDQAVKKAEQAVNAAADLLKKGIAAVLDFLANALDAILAAYQAIYNAVFDAIGAVVNLLLDAMQKIGYLVTAASQMPDHFWGQMSEEVLGMDVTQPLAFERTPEDCAKCNVPTVAEGTSPATAKGGNDELAAMLQKNEFTENDIAVDNVAPFDVNPELMASLNLQDGGEVEFGESNDPTNSMEAIKAELAGEAPETGLESAPGEASVGQSENATCCDDEQTAQAKLEQMMTQPVEGATGTQKQGEPAKQGDIPASMKTIGPLTPWQRSQYMLHQMKQGIKQWFAANWGKLLAGAIAGITGFIALNIITGGAIVAAVPPFLQIMGTVMAGVAMAQIASHVGSYFSQGWAGEIVGAAKSLARGVAVGAIELVFALLFNAAAIFKALKGGIKGAAKAAVTSIKTTVKATAKSAKELAKIGIKGAKTAFKNGKIMLKGVKSGFAKGAKSLDDIAKRLKDKLSFNKFKITFRNRELALWGHINPWKKLAFTILDEDIPLLSNQTGRSPEEIREIIYKPSRTRSVADQEFFDDSLKQITQNNVQLLANQTGRSVDEIKKILDNAESFRSADEDFILDALSNVKRGQALDPQQIQHLDDIFRRVGADLRSPIPGATMSKSGRFIEFTEDSIEHIGVRHVPEMFDPQAALRSLNDQGITDPNHITNLFPPGMAPGDRTLTTVIRQAIEKSRSAQRVFNIKVRGQNVRVVTGGAPGGAGHQVVSIFPTNDRGVTRAQIAIWANEMANGTKTLEQIRNELKNL
ncbi:hypothetical protein [Coleofasciculus chthonoplastes]|uniref:hypothetical protein n=1 Tax=Coleofasciculus chthonoplastes TaxID=64178 RepID=UPI0032FF2F20